jgi:benzoate-CoA ligase family protein
MTQELSSARIRELPRRAPTSTFNIARFLLDRHIEEGRGERLALLLPGTSVTYSELFSLANRAGNALRGLGVRPEERVALQLPDGVEFVAAFLGAMKIGAVPVPLNTAASPADLRFFLSDTRAPVLVTTPQFGMAALAVGPLDELELLRAILVVGGATPLAMASGTRLVSFERALAEAAPDLTAFGTSADEPCYWLYSSGTTGRPKAVVHLHGDMLACVVPYAEEVLAINADDRILSVPRLFFSYGLVNSLFLPLLTGTPAILIPDRPVGATLVEAIRDCHPTLLFGVPTSFSQLCGMLSGDPTIRPLLASVRLAITAGEALSDALYHRWRSLTAIELLDGLGSTEAGYIFCSNMRDGVRPGSSGRPIGDHEMKLMDPDGSEIITPEGQGELWVRAASTALMYWNRRDRTKTTFVGEWLRTGDYYRRDTDGYYWCEGRIDDLFKVSGQWVSPVEVESCLLEHAAILECAVVGVADADGLVKPKAFAVLQPGASVSVAELQEYVKARLLPHNYPRAVEFVNALPKTATGKIQRFRLREAHVAP